MLGARPRRDRIATRVQLAAPPDCRVARPRPSRQVWHQVRQTSPTELHTALTDIATALEAYQAQAPTTVQQVLFLPGGNNPAWSDAADVFARAVEQILIHTGIDADEEPFAYVGVHAMSFLTSKRNSIGFLVTNQRTLSQHDFSVVGTRPKAHSTYFVSAQSAETLTDEVWSSFVSKVDIKIDEGKRVAMRAALAGVLQIVLPELRSAGVLPDRSASSSITDRIGSLGLDSHLFRPDEGNKSFQKFITKYDVQNPVYGLIFKSILGGNIGLVITRAGIVSRDLMEPVAYSSWDEIGSTPARAGEKANQILVGEQLHVIPDQYETLTPSLITLVNEVANGTVTLP